jgi:hypothetical protein
MPHGVSLFPPAINLLKETCLLNPSCYSKGRFYYKKGPKEVVERRSRGTSKSWNVEDVRRAVNDDRPQRKGHSFWCWLGGIA